MLATLACRNCYRPPRQSAAALGTRTRHMDIQGFVLTVGAVAAGWGLNEVSQAFRARGAKRRALGKALAELLEIRHYLKAIDATFAEVRKRMPISHEDLRQGLQFFDTLLPPDPQLPQRFDAALDEIAGVDPLLAFALKNKDRIPLLLTRLRAVQLPAPVDAKTFSDVEDHLRASAIDALNASIRRVAWARDPVTWVRVVNHLRRKPTLSTQAEKLFSIGQALLGPPRAGA